MGTRWNETTRHTTGKEKTPSHEFQTQAFCLFRLNFMTNFIHFPDFSRLPLVFSAASSQCKNRHLHPRRVNSIISLFPPSHFSPLLTSHFPLGQWETKEKSSSTSFPKPQRLPEGPGRGAHHIGWRGWRRPAGRRSGCRRCSRTPGRGAPGGSGPLGGLYPYPPPPPTK